MQDIRHVCFFFFLFLHFIYPLIGVSDTMLEVNFKSNSTPQNWLVR